MTSSDNFNIYRYFRVTCEPSPILTAKYDGPGDYELRYSKKGPCFPSLNTGRRIRAPLPLDGTFPRIMHKEQAKKAANHNMLFSPIHKLPLELIWIIGRMLSPAERLSMRRVSRQLRWFLDPLGPEIQADALSRLDRLQFVFLLRRDAGSLGDPSGELVMPSPRLLSPGWTISGDGIRQPHPLEGSIMLTKGQSVSSECLLNGLHDFRTMSIAYGMPLDFLGLRGRWEKVQGKVNEAEVIFENGAKVELKKELPVSLLMSKQRAPHYVVFDALARINEEICPHLRTNSSNLFSDELQDPNGQHPDPEQFIGRWYIEDYGLARHLRRAFKCKARHCHTKYHLQHGKMYSDVVVFLKVSRTFAHFDDSWKAQVVHDRDGHDFGIPNPRCLSRGQPCTGRFCAANYQGLVVTQYD